MKSLITLCATKELRGLRRGGRYCKVKLTYEKKSSCSLVVAWSLDLGARLCRIACSNTMIAALDFNPQACDANAGTSPVLPARPHLKFSHVFGQSLTNNSNLILPKGLPSSALPSSAESLPSPPPRATSRNTTLLPLSMAASTAES